MDFAFGLLTAEDTTSCPKKIIRMENFTKRDIPHEDPESRYIETRYSFDLVLGINEDDVSLIFPCVGVLNKNVHDLKRNK